MLVRRAPGLFSLDVPHRVATVAMGARATIIDTGEGVAVHSPVRMTDADLAEIRAIGEVRWIIAPSLMHYAFVPDARRAFPGACVVGAPGLREKRPALGIERVAGEDPALERVLPSRLVEGMARLNEVVFLHAPTRTLVACDLFFHMVRNDDAWSRAYFRLNRAWGRPAHTVVHRLLTTDRAVLRASVARLLEWDFDRVLVAHGEPVETGGHDAIRAAFAWV